MSWPGPEEYTAAVARPSAHFANPDLAGATPALGLHGAPLAFLGQAGCVFKLSGQSGQAWAVKCFTQPITDLQRRYHSIGEHLKSRELPFLVECEYLPQGIRIQGEWFPVVKMEWIEGAHLHTFIRDRAHQPRTLLKLARVWLRLSMDLRASGIGHGDLQHGNILLTAGARTGKVAVRLIDYDDLQVPAIAALPHEETGHPCYQHPGRAGQVRLDIEVDRFSHLVIYTALLALAAGPGRQLWERYDSGDNLLFRSEDFTTPMRSPLLRTLWDLGGDIRVLVGHLTLAAQNPCNSTPLLHELVAAGAVAPLNQADLDRVAVLLGVAAAPARPAVPAAPEQEQLTLEVVDGPGCGRRFAFAGHDTFVVGRSNRAHFTLASEDRFCSRYHFLIEINPPHCILLDLGSRNGTFVNRQQVQRAVLHNGDEVRAGRTGLHIHIPEFASSVAEPVPSPAVLAEQVVEVPPTPPVPAPVETVLLPGCCLSCQGQVSETSPLALCEDCRERMNRQVQFVPGYRIVREVGRGGMGVVYLALRESDHRPVAVKTIMPKGDPSPLAVARFLREASILRQLHHPNIVTYRDLGSSDECLYFAMEFVRGTDASRLLRQKGSLSLSHALALVRQILAGLSHAHNQRFVHRDIKPSNLLICQEDGKDRLYIADFGLARLYQASQLSGLTLMGDKGGTLAFMPPEQILAFRDVLPASDQYAAAATLYNLLTGQHVYDGAGTAEQQLAQILNDEPIPIQQRRPDLPDELARVVHRALARQPEDRWPDVGSFANALRPFET